MRCKEIDMIAYIEGRASEAAKTHIEHCRTCRNECERLSRFMNIVPHLYAEGKRLEGELDNELKSMDPATMKRLPADIARKVAGLKEENVVARLRKVIGKGKDTAREFVEGVLAPSIQPMPAISRDITKAGKKRKPVKKPARKAKPKK